MPRRRNEVGDRALCAASSLVADGVELAPDEIDGEREAPEHTAS